MRRRLELLVLVVALAAAGAFLVSFAAQWWGRAAEEPAGEGAPLLPQPSEPEFDPGRVKLEPRIRVEVLNAAGKAGLARQVMDRLRAEGFDVVYFGNAEAFGRDSSEVLDRVGKPAAARRVADALDIERVRTELDSALYLDVTVVLGQDWAPAEPATHRSWWSRAVARIARLLKQSG